MSAFDLSPMELELISRLGSTSLADLDWLTAAQIWSYFDEACTKLATLGLFVNTNTFQTQVGVSAYSTAANWLETIFASITGQRLRPSSTAELEALDAGWTTTPGQPDRYAMDAAQLGTIALYPVPIAVQTVRTIDQVTAPAIAAAQTTAPINPLIQDYMLYFALARARGHESPQAMPEVAAMAMQTCQMLEQVFATYWGTGELREA